MSKVEVLMSIMSQKAEEIVKRTNIKSPAVVVNQCDRNDRKNIIINEYNVNYIDTTDRGLSKSRNLAIQEAKGDYCLLCDDDEVLDDDHVEKIEASFRKYTDADIICFIITRDKKKYPQHNLRINYLNSLRISSVQMVIKRTSIINNNIKFDENFGAGSPNGAGEENIFMFDCLKKNLKIYYVPVVIGNCYPLNQPGLQVLIKIIFLKEGEFLEDYSDPLGIFIRYILQYQNIKGIKITYLFYRRSIYCIKE